MDFGLAFFTVVIWATMGILLSLPVMRIIHRSFIEKTMEGMPALVIILLMVTGLAILMKFSGLLQSVIYLLVLDVAALLTPLLDARRERKLLLELQDEDIARCQRAIRFDPNNAAAHAALAEIYAKRKLYDLAIPEYEQAIALDPKGSGTERYKLRMLQRDMASTPEHIYRCEQCGCETPSTQRCCRKCGEVLRPGFFTWVRRPENYRAILRQSAFYIASFMLLGMLVSQAFSLVPSIIIGVLLIGLLIAGVWLFLRRLGGE